MLLTTKWKKNCSMFPCTHIMCHHLPPKGPSTVLSLQGLYAEMDICTDVLNPQYSQRCHSILPSFTDAHCGCMSDTGCTCAKTDHFPCAMQGLYTEMDFRNEALNAQRMAQLLEERWVLCVCVCVLGGGSAA